MSTLLTPPWKLYYRGVDITTAIDHEVISVTYTDKKHGENDEIEVTVKDDTGKWINTWCPEDGDEVELFILDKMGIPVPCGTFEIDEPEASLGRAGNTFSFRGVSAPVTKAIRTKRTVEYEQVDLFGIANKVAASHGFQVIGTVPDLKFDRITQRQETDLGFLARIADQYGCYFTVRGKQLIFTDRSKLHEREAVRIISQTDSDFQSAALKRQTDETYSKAKVEYFDGNKKKKLSVQVSDGDVKTGDTLRLNERFESEAHGKRRAESELQKKNAKQYTADVVMKGDPYLLAGNIVELGPDFGKWARRYIIDQSRHHLTRTSHSTNISLEKIKEAAVKGATGTGSKSAAGGTTNTGSNGRMGFASPSQRA